MAGLISHTGLWKGGRVDDRDCLENSKGESLRGFESLPFLLMLSSSMAERVTVNDKAIGSNPI